MARKGAKRAIIAIGRKMLVSIYYMLNYNVGFKELGSEFIDLKVKEKRIDYYLKQLKDLGVTVN